MNLTLKSVLKNKQFLYSLFSQFVTLGVSVMMTLGVTKFLSVESFGYWQLFIFYTSYIGLAHFGVCDGMYLKYGGKSFDEINKNEVKGIFNIFFIGQLIIACVLFLYSLFFVENLERQFIITAISILLFFSNFQVFLSYILLSSNKIIENSRSIFIEKLCMLLLIILLILFNVVTYKSLIIIFFISKILSILYLLKYFKEFYSINPIVNFNVFSKIIKSGFILMMSNIVNTLIIGFSRYFIDRKWDIEIFGKISLSISLVYFILLLLTQISFILFPYLRNCSEVDQKIIFLKLNKKISLILKGCILLYIPLMFILNYLLPNYEMSLNYLILLLPMCLYDGKMQILYTTFFKNLFMQKKMFLINIFSMLISIIFTIIGVYLFANLTIVILGLVISIIIRSIISEIILYKKFNITNNNFLILDALFSILIIIFYFFKGNNF